MVHSNSRLARLALAFTLVFAAPDARAQQGWDFFDKPPPLPRWTETGATPEPRPLEAAAPRFGAKGEFVVTGGSNISISSEQYSASPASAFSATFSPGLDYFVAPNLSIGVTADIAYSDNQGYDASGNLFASKTTTLTAGPRIGFNVPFGEYLSWYPRIAFGLVNERTDEQLVTAAANPNGASFVTSSGSATGAWADVFAPILIHPARHFFLGVGPKFSHDFTHLEGTSTITGQPTTISGQFVIGGWWGGTPDVDRRDASVDKGASTPLRRSHRMGLHWRIRFRGLLDPVQRAGFLLERDGRARFRLLRGRRRFDRGKRLHRLRKVERYRRYGNALHEQFDDLRTRRAPRSQHTAGGDAFGLPARLLRLRRWLLQRHRRSELESSVALKRMGLAVRSAARSSGSAPLRRVRSEREPRALERLHIP